MCVVGGCRSPSWSEKAPQQKAGTSEITKILADVPCQAPAWEQPWEEQLSPLEEGALLGCSKELRPHKAKPCGLATRPACLSLFLLCLFQHRWRASASSRSVSLLPSLTIQRSRAPCLSAQINPCLSAMNKILSLTLCFAAKLPQAKLSRLPALDLKTH